ARFSSGGQGARMAEEVVHVFSCTFEGGGETTVPAGSRIVLLFGWAAKNRGLVQAFLQAQTTTISLNGAAPIDISDSYSPIKELPADRAFASNVRHNTGVTLSAGESLQADGTIVVSHPVVDFFDEATHRPVLFQPGHPISFSCRITASA
ncbi:MAG TPA: hypothetical protein VFP81_03980, partial [Propionibacteriaceae bacterium]|nr:hypothetical protein [Propionibacteriaceae bacterium]